MNSPDSIVQVQAEALLRRVAREQESRCLRLRGAAEEQAKSIVARAWEEARARLRQAVDEERRAIEKALGDHRASLETAARLREQSVLREIMDEGWRELPSTLAARWRDAEGRAAWCRSACAQALATLHAGPGWVVEVDADAPGDAREAARAALAPGDGLDIRWHDVAGLGPGLRIRSGRACVDATVAGLLASRERVESELLAELERLAGHAAREAP